MSTIDVPALGALKSANLWTISYSFAALYLIYHVTAAFYEAFLGPRSKYPGPKLRALSRWPRIISMVKGNDATVTPALHRKYGPVVRVAPNEISYANGAQAYKDIYGFRKQGIYKDPLMYTKPFNGVDTLIGATDSNHSRQRKLVSHAFADKSLKDLEPMLKQWTGLMKDKLAEQVATGGKVDMLKYYNCTTFDIMGDLSFNEGLNMLRDGEYSSWVKAIFLGIKDAVLLRSVKLSSSLGTYIVDKFVMNNQTIRVKQAEHWKYSKERVDRRLARTPERPDLWSKILEKSQGPDGLSVDEHHSLAALFMVAGTETTATALSGCTYHLLKNPQYLAKLTKEIRDTHSSYEELTLESIARLKYLHAILQEGLRMYPPVPSWLPRITPSQGAEICGEFVPGDTGVAVHNLSTFRSEEHWTKPYEFRPERWLGDDEFKNDHLDAMEPFSVGPRNCVGKNLAWHEMRLLLTTTLLHFDLELCEESKTWSDQKVYTLWEKVPLMCKLTQVKA